MVLRDHINSMKPNVTALPSSLQVSVGDENEVNATATSGKNFHGGKEGNPFTNFMRNRKKAHKTTSSTHDDDLSSSSTPVELDKNATIVS